MLKMTYYDTTIATIIVFKTPALWGGIRLTCCDCFASFASRSEWLRFAKPLDQIYEIVIQNMIHFCGPDGRTDISSKTPYFLTDTFLNLFQKVRIFVLFEALLASPLETNFCHQSPFVSANLVSRIGSGLCTLLP